MKKILILGAGVYQVPLIKTAKEMGLYTIVSSIPGNYPGFSIADKVYYENTRDYEKILEIAKKERIDGITTVGTDVAVITIGRICDELGLPGLSFEAAKASSNKSIMKACYEKYGVKTAKFRKIQYSDEDYKSKLAELSFPMIFKTVDSSGSRGITRVNSESEFDTARKAALDNTISDHFVVEEYIEGTEFGAQAYVEDGEVKFILPHGDYLIWNNTGVPTGHYAPYDISPSVLKETKYQLELAIKSMGLDNCGINADFIIRGDEVFVLEVGGRAGGACLCDLTSIYYGYNYYEKILQAAMGEDVTFEACDGTPPDEYQGTPNACMMLRSDKDGKIVSQKNNNIANPDILDIRFDYNVGDEVSKFRVSPDRIGHVITKGKTLNDAVNTLNTALNNIHIIVE